MIIIYDFDGTLTKFPFPKYQILNETGITREKLEKEIKKQFMKCFNFYKAFYFTYIRLLKENNIDFSKKNVCLGSSEVEFNNGVKEYFDKFEASKTGIKHYIVTSGIQYFVEETAIKKYIKSIYGVTFTKENGVYKKVDFLLTDKKKVNVIKKILKDKADGESVVYIGDGVTDKYAFKYIHSIGGTNIFVMLNEVSKKEYNKLNTKVTIDKCFNSDFSENSELNNYISQLLKEEKNRGVKCY